MSFLKTNLHLRKLASISLCALSLSITQAQSSEIQTLEDLKTLQSKILSTVEKVQPTTVALSSTNSKSSGSGSGVIVSEDGLILTAAHVVQHNREIDVIFADGKVLPGKVLGANFTKDIAMVQITQQKKWKFAKIGNSAAMKIGDYVVAMGHAGGYNTRRKPPVRFGRLLSKNTNGFITTDCTIIGGDSGGPLFDLEGNVIGINSSIGNLWPHNNHAGITALLADWDRLARGDTWGRLAQNPLIDPDSPVMGFLFKELPRAQGVVVIKTLKNSPAKRAGIKKGDIITAVDDEVIKRHRDLIAAMAHRKAGDNVTITLFRRNKKLQLNLILTKRGQFFKP